LFINLLQLYNKYSTNPQQADNNPQQINASVMEFDESNWLVGAKSVILLAVLHKRGFAVITWQSQTVNFVPHYWANVMLFYKTGST